MTMPRSFWSICVILAACGATQPPVDPSTAQTDIARVIDDWHDAAARSDEARYFDHLSEDSIFLGTDATERWTKPEFRAYAHPHFEAGRGWVFRSTRRDVMIEGRLAWFDEDLDTEGLGPARGSGVLRLEPDGVWRIVQYNLAITVPNDRFDSVRALLAGPAEGP
jgi:ketosteroid isomerase-like protein